MLTPGLYGAIEAGGTKFVCAAARDVDDIVADTRIPTSTPERTLRDVAEFFAAASADLGRFDAFGVGSFGPVDLNRRSPTFGRLLETPKAGWADTDLVTPLVQRFGCPVRIDTDVNAAALAEASRHSEDAAATLVYITVGTGIGGGAIVNGDTLKGLVHPEMGHTRVVRDTRDAGFAGVCPFHGDCLEGLASGPAIVMRYGAPLDRLPAGHRAFEIVGGYLGQLAANAILMLSPQHVVFGGGVMKSEALFPVIRTTTARLLGGYAGGGSAESLERIIVAPRWGERSGLVGAIMLAKSATRIKS
jgi:fructokinase